MKIREIRELPRYLRRRARMPIARFELISSREPELVSVALNDVVLLDPEDTMAEVKERAAQIARFREKGLLTTSGGDEHSVAGAAVGKAGIALRQRVRTGAELVEQLRGKDYCIIVDGELAPCCQE